MRAPARCLARRYGELVMLSMPPATITSAEPALIMSWAKMAACIPDPQTLLTVTASAEFGRPAPSAAWRAGAWPRPAGSTQPMNTLSTCSPLTPARSSAALIAVAPRSVAFTGARAPWKPPMGVRANEAMTMGSVVSDMGGSANCCGATDDLRRRPTQAPLPAPAPHLHATRRHKAIGALDRPPVLTLLEA